MKFFDCSVVRVLDSFHFQDTAYEAKHQCAIQNGVKILYSKDYQKCVDYVLEKYGEKFFENCKAKKGGVSQCQKT